MIVSEGLHRFSARRQDRSHACGSPTPAPIARLFPTRNGADYRAQRRSTANLRGVFGTRCVAPPGPGIG